MKKIVTVLVVLCLMLAGLTACITGGATPIADIVGDIRTYEDKEVTVSGEVVNSVSILILKYFTLRDSTGEIAVVTERSLPLKGEKLTVRGRVKAAFSLGDQRMIVIMESRGK